MILYLTIIFIAMILISIPNIIFCVGTIYSSALVVITLVVIGVVFQFGIDAIFAVIVSKWLPDSWFAPNKKLYQVSKKEQRFYEKLGIKKWKDKVWELGGLGGFSKAKINDPANPAYFEKFMLESNKGIFVHIAGMIAGFSYMLLLPGKMSIYIALPICMVNLFLNIPSICILRYNIPKLQVAQKRAIRNIDKQINK